MAPPHLDDPVALTGVPSHAALQRRRTLLISGLAASLFGAVLVLLGLWYFFQMTPRDYAGDQQRITIHQGDGLHEVGQKLENQGIIRNSFVFYTFGRIQGIGNKLQAGTYVFSPSQNVHDIFTHLKEGKVDQLRATIVPGRTLKELKQDFIKYGFNENEIDTAFNYAYPHEFLKGRPQGASLEGYIYPETYDIPGDGGLTELISLTLSQFERQIVEQKIAEKLQARGFTLHQGITLASVIQQEVPEPQDQRQVSQIFQKRLKQNMPLGADATFVYAAKQLGVEPRVNLESPYNTRIKKGIPPGPIGNFNMSALTAVIEPAPGDYLYFVSGDDGTTHFAVTLDEHEKNTRNHCKKLCALF